MAWLFGQIWFWALLAFLVGALLAWLLATLLMPHEREAFADLGRVDVEGGRS